MIDLFKELREVQRTAGQYYELSNDLDEDDEQSGLHNQNNPENLNSSDKINEIKSAEQAGLKHNIDSFDTQQKLPDMVLDYVSHSEDRFAHKKREKSSKRPKPVRMLSANDGVEKEKKPIVRLDEPGLTTQQKIWIGTQTLVWAVMPLMLYIFLPALLMYIGMFIRQWNGSTDNFINASGNFYYAIGIVVCFIIIRWRIVRKGESFQEAVTLYLKETDVKKSLSYAFFGLSASLFLSAVFTLLPFFSGYKTMTEKAFQRTDLILAMISVVITAPICEEIIFRGLMLNRLLTRFSEKTAVLLTAIIFAVCHANPVWICYAFVMGWLLAFVSVKEDNIYYSIVMHMAFNVWTVIQLIIRQFDGLYTVLFGSKMIIFIYGLLAFICMFAWIKMNPEFMEKLQDWLQKQERI